MSLYSCLGPRSQKPNIPHKLERYLLRPLVMLSCQKKSHQISSIKKYSKLYHNEIKFRVSFLEILKIKSEVKSF